MAGFFNTIPHHGQTHSVGQKAYYYGNGQANDSIYPAITIKAVSEGIAWNGITLTFDGSSTIDETVISWNDSNPSLLLAITGGDSEVIPTEGEIVTLDGGEDIGTDVLYNSNTPTFSGIVIGDNVLVDPNEQAAIKLKADKTFFGSPDGEYGLLVEKLDAGVLGQDNTLISFTGVNEAIGQYRDILFTTGYFTQFILTTNGSVGIGIPSPQSKLDVGGSIRFSDSDDINKKAVLDASLISSETTVTLSVPNLSGTILLDTLLQTTATAPTSTTSSGVAGEIRADSDYIYICTATDTWKRTSVTGW